MILLLQNRGESGSSWLFNLAFVVFFFVLPIVRTIFERRKRKQAGTPVSPDGAPKESVGRDLWKQLLEGQLDEEDDGAQPAAGPQAGPPASATPPAPRERSAPAAPPLAAGTGRRSSAPLAPPAPSISSPSREPALRARKRPSAPSAPGSGLPAKVRERISDGEGFGELRGGIESRRALPKSAATRGLGAGPARMRDSDPGTLDEELVTRWSDGSLISRGGASPEAVEPGVEPHQVLDPATATRAEWRRAIVLSEMLSPPLALRGASSAWPGPPAAFASPPR